MRRPRRAGRDASVIVLATFCVSQAALIFHAAGYASTLAIHARYAGFVYALLLVYGLGVFWQWGRRSKRRGLWLATLLLAYAFLALRVMWLPPLPFNH